MNDLVPNQKRPTITKQMKTKRTSVQISLPITLCKGKTSPKTHMKVRS